MKEAASAPGDHQGTSPTPEEMKTIKETLTSAFIEKYGTTHADRFLAYDEAVERKQRQPTNKPKPQEMFTTRKKHIPHGDNCTTMIYSADGK